MVIFILPKNFPPTMAIKTDFSIIELTNFLLEARKHGYATQAEHVVEPQRPGFKEFPIFRDGKFSYIDSYAGYYYAPGQEVIRYDGKPVWNMAYNGGMLAQFHGERQLTKETFAFLREALQLSDFTHPFRGPSMHNTDLWSYYNLVEGDMAKFRGTETIFIKRHDVEGMVYEQDYMGGLIIHKV
jgi:hypothetical protein